jgi:Cytochrome P450
MSCMLQVCTEALYNLATNPQHVKVLRDEIKEIIDKEGWTKDAIRKMHKVDSYLKETMRVEGVTRQCKPPITFLNIIPHT